MNHDSGSNRDRPEIFQNSLIERTPKAAFWASNLSPKHSRPFPSDLKTDKEVLKASSEKRNRVRKHCRLTAKFNIHSTYAHRRWRQGLWPPLLLDNV